ncbi:MAG: antibiotic biosynthesis monooxygenase [Thermodesulfovibrionales bacterium]
MDTKILATLKMIVGTESWRHLLETIRQRDLLETARGMLQPVRVEKGCLSYHLYEDVENRNAFVLIGEWATQQDIERHFLTDNQRLLLALMELLNEQPELRFDSVSHTAGMELIENVLGTEAAR